MFPSNGENYNSATATRNLIWDLYIKLEVCTLWFGSVYIQNLNWYLYCSSNLVQFSSNKNLLTKSKIKEKESIQWVESCSESNPNSMQLIGDGSSGKIWSSDYVSNPLTSLVNGTDLDVT